MKRLLVAIVVLIGLAAALVWWLTPPRRFIYGVAPIERDQAVLFTRRNEDRATYFWVELVGREGQAGWSTEVSPLEPSEALGFSGVVASRDLVVVLGHRERRTVVVGLDRKTGEVRWETTLPPAESVDSRIGPVLIADGSRVYAIHDARVGERSAEQITALSLDDGKLLWTLDGAAKLGWLLRAWLLAPDRLFVTGDESRLGLELDGATGRVLRSVEMPSRGCVAPEGVIGFDGASVLFFPAADAALERIDLEAGFWPSSSAPCGVRGADLIVGLERSGARELVLQRLERGTGKRLWSLPLGPRWIFEPTETLDGRLPRFLPVLLFGSEVEGGPVVKELVILDLDAGSVVERIRTEDQPVGFVTAERAFVWARIADVMAALDPETGRRARATALRAANLSDTRAEDYRFGQLWVAGTEWERPGALPWVAFDLATGAPARTNGQLSHSDVTARGWPGAVQR